MMNASKKDTRTWPPSESAEWSEEARELLARLDPERLPRSIAVIMDGNGRWARSRGWADRIRGHEAGIESVREITRSCAQLHLDALILYAFSKENWGRPRHETLALMRLLERFAVGERDELMKNDVSMRAIGRIEDLPDGTRKAVEETIRLTSKNTGLRLTLALSYGGRDELTRAARRIAEEAAAGRLAPEDLTEERFAGFLDTQGSPDPDLLIRTSGEVRISNFLLWQIAYAELHVTPVLWPDFRRPDLLRALIDYQGRDRRFGLVDPGPKRPVGAKE